MSRREPNGKYDWLYAAGTIVAVCAFWSIPLFLSRVEMGEPAPPAQAAAVRPAVTVPGGALVFRDPAQQAREFIGYYHTIELTPGQEAIKKEALGSMPAACCAGSTAYTCCCPCNLSKTIWGLSNFVIAKHGADAKQVRGAVDAWLGYVNPDGYTGNACYRGACDATASRNGCGGMHEEKLTV